MTPGQYAELNESVIKRTGELFPRMQERAVEEFAAEHGGYRPRFFSTDADFLEGNHGSVEKRSALQIDQQVTPLARLFGWNAFISWDFSIWYAPMNPPQVSVRRRGPRPAQQPILRWRAADPGVLELTGFDGEVELIACQKQLFMRLMQIGAHSKMGTPKTREIAELGLRMIALTAA
ncbi:hypothetical protein OKW41_006125 [Paraburkholderia sp. UCT70]|uniref:hypothetical protein n=1 Tax=Paraburkholderia sp. UCT70 TaxID=2991068 RepID=UPI003D1C2F0A